MKLTRLSSGYWLAWWNGEIWAQWPCDRDVCADDFFNAAWTATPARFREIGRRRAAERTIS